MSTDVQTLQEMGFTKNSAERALYKTGYKGVQLAMDWLFAHEADPDIDDPFTPPQGQAIGSTTSSDSSTAQASTEAAGQALSSENDEAVAAMAAKSLKCDDCGKLLKSELDAQAHAARTQHTNFSESVEEIKPLTEEERRERMNLLQDRMKKLRQEREEKEAKEQLAREKARRTSGREIGGIKQKFEEDEIKRIAEQRRREKMEDKLARQKIKDQIEKDRAERSTKFPKSGQQADAVTSSPAPASSAPSAEAQPAAQKEYDECRLQIRLPNGQALTQTFKAKEPLGAVRLYVEMNRKDGTGAFSLMTNFPKKVFTDEDMEKPLHTLGLVPSAVLMVRPA